MTLAFTGCRFRLRHLWWHILRHRAWCGKALRMHPGCLDSLRPHREPELRKHRHLATLRWPQDDNDAG